MLSIPAFVGSWPRSDLTHKTVFPMPTGHADREKEVSRDSAMTRYLLDSPHFYCQRTTLSAANRPI